MKAAISSLIDAIRKEQDESIIKNLESKLSVSLEEASKEETFTDIPTENILNIIVKSQIQDSHLAIAIATRIMKRISVKRPKEAPFLLSFFTFENATFDECISFISSLSCCQACKRLGKLYKELMSTTSSTTGTKASKSSIATKIKKEGTLTAWQQGFTKDFNEACQNGALENVKYLVEHGEDVNKKGCYGVPIKVAVTNGKLKIVKYLVEHGAIINTGDFDAPLLIATKNGFLPIIQYLVEQGADIEAVDESNHTPILIASTRNDFEIIKYLAEQGADLEATDKYDQTPLVIVSLKQNFEAVEYLVEKGAYIHVTDSDGTRW